MELFIKPESEKKRKKEKEPSHKPQKLEKGKEGYYIQLEKDCGRSFIIINSLLRVAKILNFASHP